MKPYPKNVESRVAELMDEQPWLTKSEAIQSVLSKPPSKKPKKNKWKADALHHRSSGNYGDGIKT